VTPVFYIFMETILTEYQKSEYMNPERMQKIEEYFSKINIVAVPENNRSWFVDHLKHFKDAIFGSRKDAQIISEPMIFMSDTAADSILEVDDIREEGIFSGERIEST
jgi:hypothetical protein